MMIDTDQRELSRSAEITERYMGFLDQHIADVVSGKQMEFMEINQIANEIFISHQHLTDTVQKETGHHPCFFYDTKIVEMAKRMLTETQHSVAEIARLLTYDPSNFSKFFKNFTGTTPGQFRADLNLPKSTP